MNLQASIEIRRPKGRLWERSSSPRAYVLQPRDVELIRQVFRHRYLRPVHLDLLLGGSRDNLRRRLKVLWEHRFLERPRGQRPLRALVEELIYALGPEGAKLLDRFDPSYRLSELDWAETPKKVRSWSSIDHELGVADFLITLQAACNRVSSSTVEVRFNWDGYPNLKTHRFRAGKQAVQPDAFFEIAIPGRGTASHYLEFDRNNVSLKRMRARYFAYYRFWRERRAKGIAGHFRVLTVCDDPDHVGALRRVASEIGEREKAWRGFWFTHTRRYAFENPISILTPIFEYADGEEKVSLVEPFIPLSR